MRSARMKYRGLLQLTMCRCLLILWVAVVAACSKPGDSTDNTIDYWTCAMHPSVHAKAPGKCPICGMDLVVVMEPIELQQRIGVTYTEVESRRMRFDIRAVGTLEADQGQVFECAARVNGFIEGLQVTSPGERVTAGQPLMTVDSQDLRAPQQDFINLLAAQSGGTAPPVAVAERRGQRYFRA
jgi:Cu(I)/Ag(I) efflux system membrane fusion protein